MIRRLIFLPLLLLLAIPAYAAGIISFNLDQTALATPPGGVANPTCQNFATLQCVIFTGAFSFTTEQDYFVNDIAITMNPSNPGGGTGVVGNDAYFFVTVPGAFGPDGIASGAYQGGLFEVDVAASAPSGIYRGTATLQASDSNGNPISATQSFEVEVVPEPGTLILGLAGIASLAIRRKYRRR